MSVQNIGISSTDFKYKLHLIQSFNLYKGHTDVALLDDQRDIKKLRKNYEETKDLTMMTVRVL